MNSTYNIILARHGQTNFNVEGKIQDPLAPHLTDKGKLQANSLKLKLESLKLYPDLVICADATRNIETLKVVFPEFVNMNNVTIEKRLQERYHKDLIGKTKADIESEFNTKFADRLSWELYFEGTEKSLLTDKFPNDETMESVNLRIISLVTDLPNKGIVLLLGSSIINQYFIEYFTFGSIGVQKPVTPEGIEIDFQENNEIRILELDSNKKLIEYTSVSF